MSEGIHQYQTVEATIEIENAEILEYLTEIVVTVRQHYKLFNYKSTDGTLNVDTDNGILTFKIDEVDTGEMDAGYPIEIMINAINTDGDRVTSNKYIATEVEDNIYKVVMT